MNAAELAQVANAMHNRYMLLLNPQKLQPNLDKDTGMPFWDGFNAAVEGVSALQDIWGKKKVNKLNAEDAEGMKNEDPNDPALKKAVAEYIGALGDQLPAMPASYAPNAAGSIGFGDVFGGTGSGSIGVGNVGTPQGFNDVSKMAYNPEASITASSFTAQQPSTGFGQAFQGAQTAAMNAPAQQKLPEIQPQQTMQPIGQPKIMAQPQQDRVNKAYAMRDALAQNPNNVSITQNPDGTTTKRVSGLYKGNPSVPTSDNPLAQAVGGVNASPQSEYQRLIGALKTAKYLDDSYDYQNWRAADRASGVKNPLISMVRYASMIAPLREKAEQDRMKEAFRIANDPKYANSPARTEALAALAYYTKNANLANDIDWANKEHKIKEEKWDREKSLFGTEDELNSLKIAGARERLRGAGLDNDLKELSSIGDYAGVNLEGDAWYKKNDAVDLSGLQRRAAAGLNHAGAIFKLMFGEKMMVTSGRDSDKHMNSKYSHYTGWKVDVSSGMDSKKLEDPEERARFIKALNSVGIIVNDEWGKDKHLDLNFQNYHGGNLGNKSNKNKNSKETGSKYDSQSLADTINATYTEGKTRGTDAERADIGKKMSGAVGLVASPYDNWQVATEKLYDYYDKTLGAQKGWNLNSEEFSHLVGRAIHDFYLENTGTDIPVNMVAKYIFDKRDPESLKLQEEARKWKEENKNKPQTVEDQARKVLGVDANGHAVHKPMDSKPTKQKEVGSKLSRELDKPISFGNIFGKDRKKADDYD